jgi:hypothetical protein
MQRVNPGEQEKTREVALKILRYLQENPRAADTASGILEWWLLKQSITEEQNVVEAALKVLIEKNLIDSTTAIDGRKHYYLNAGQVKKSQRLIGETDDDERGRLA